MSDKPVLYIGEKNVSSWSMRPWVALRHKGVAFEEGALPIAGDTDRSRRRAVSPTGRVPVLHHRGLVIPDSMAIIEYAEEIWPAPKHAPLWPSDTGRRAHARWLSATMHSGYMKMREHLSFNTCFLPKRKPAPPDAVADVHEMLRLLEAALAAKGQGEGPYLFGDFSAADAMYAPAVVRVLAYEVPTQASPLATAWMRALVESPAVRPWIEAARALPPVESY
ncbi:MAG TPA: glutathione S-transferase family protein [Candidatus Polarisedimenticolia bacterium]|nr:glutathione S-transferase family protein [Candidatus Polarisedimenticolia bacterium]